MAIFGNGSGLVPGERTVSALEAGSARVEITPEVPVPLSGYVDRETPSTGVHDPLGASALVFDDGATMVAIVSVDLLNVSRELTAGVRSGLAAEGVGIDALLLAATHTHAGPYVPARALDVRPSCPPDVNPDVVDRIKDGIVEAVKGATESVMPATIRVGAATNETTPVNRRALGGVGGRVRVPAGEVDPELIALLVETGSDRAVLFNYACHPVCTTPAERLVSADWPGRVRNTLGDAGTLADATILFLNGAAGDVNPRDWSGRREGEAVYEYMSAIGTEVADTVREALADAREATPINDAPVFTDRCDLALPVKTTPPARELESQLDALEEEITRLEEGGNEEARETRSADRSYLRELKRIAEWDVARLPAEVRYVEIGDVGLLGMPGEVFVEHGLTFKSEARAETLLPVGYANGYVGYLPTLRDLENGGYEVQTTKVDPAAIPAFRHACLDTVTP